MFFRSHRVDYFISSFTKFIAGSLFIVGCLLLLTAFKYSTSSHEKLTRSGESQRSFGNFTDTHLSTNIKNGLQSIRTVETKNSKSPNIGTIKTWYKEYFPDNHFGKKVSIILGLFRKKVALHGRSLINPHNFKYIHNVPNACIGRNIELIAGIPTQTWGQYGSVPANNAVVLFFLGSKEDEALQEKINFEALKYGDIVQEHFIDSYRNLSLKTVAIMKWVSIYCADSTFVLKADDDMYINIPRLVMRLREQLKRGPVFILGAVHYNTEPFRDQKNKWFVTFDEYPANMFPNYMSGTAYAMTSTAAIRLYVESLYVRNLFLEDVYLTGIVADKAAVPRVKEADFTWGKFDPEGCNFKNKISGHKNSPEEIRKIHRELFDPNLRCH
ncbi:unnamed protein product [Candidula unifasciata]|uniref:Hexosyltransferase n=1 Tax=Candidula unifasciata TaxID=100452 RepID=A0A8S3YS04_9EUPU|nr:unnamed protein product [Candidula unifasciata]